MYKGIEAPNKIWLLYDHGRYHALSCFKALYNASQAEHHECDIQDHNDSNSKQQLLQRKTNTCSFPTYRAHFLVRLNAKWSATNQGYVIYDIESYPTAKHTPNKAIVI
jgi:hypothetical protein